MKTSVFAATFVASLVMAGAGTARAAGQPQLPGDMQGKESAQDRMETKRELDADKYQKPLPNSTAGQNAANQTETGPQPGQTGAGERGTKVAPSTEPGQPSQPTTAQTGVGPRGTKVAPSTNPGQAGQQTETR